MPGVTAPPALPPMHTRPGAGRRVIPRGPAPIPRRILAWVLDAVCTVVPFWITALVVGAFDDANGGGQTDRAIFGAVGLLASVAAAFWNLGWRVGRRGRSVGDALTALTVRDKHSRGPLGLRGALARSVPGTAEVVMDATALDEGFIPIAGARTPAMIRRKRIAGLVVLLVVLVLCIAASVAIGARALTFAEVWHGLAHSTGNQTDVIVTSLRIPRTVLAVLAGAALGVVGALIQGYTRNPLADSGLLGLNAGAALAVVIAIYVFHLANPAGYLWFAFGGALLASVVVFGFSSIGGGATTLTLPLAGAAVAFSLQAMTQAVILTDQNTLDVYRFWVVGSVAGRGSDIIWSVLPFIIGGLVLAIAATPGLNLLSLGDDVARGLGVNVGASRVLGVAAITVLAGAATAACGPIAFLGLVVPHIARTITGPDYRWLVPYSALLGAALLLLADVVGRVVARPGELQVGIVLAVIGGPFFVALVRRRKLAAL